MYKVFLYAAGVYLALLLVVCVLAASVGYASKENPIDMPESVPEVVAKEESFSIASQPLLFVGDIMMGRNVEREMGAQGAAYPTAYIRDFLSSYPFVIANFEATIPRRHVPTPSMTFQFSVATSVIPMLVESGFTHMTLANNHAYDYGKAGYLHTMTTLREQGVVTGGSPEQVTKDDVLVIDAEGMRVALVPIYAVFATPSMTALAEAFAYAQTVSDVQVAVIHWGDEYMITNNAKQARVAHQVVDLGADAVIGHHPHVIQNIELYRSVPIFYSLGNFIFDQYWNSEVKTGLAVSLARKGDMLEYALFPVFSERSNPRILEGFERETVLKTLASVSDESLSESVAQGGFSVPFPFLASE